MRTNSYQWSMNHLFLQNKIVGNKINENIQSRITSPTYYIPESLQRHKPLEKGVKIIYGFNYQLLHRNQK